ALFSRNREFRCLRAATRGSASGLRDLFEKRSIKNFNDNPIEVSRQTGTACMKYAGCFIFAVQSGEGRPLSQGARFIKVFSKLKTC
ncbi:MAG: hypothetical protein IKI58_10455, partial [Oscillospiraceae bacterium]|nr:hypothetical protein [Oscillospiraceae bacterium]